MNKHYHYGQTIKEYRQKRGMSQATLAEYWPGHPVNIRYVQFVDYVDTCTRDRHMIFLRRTYVLFQKEQVNHASPPCPREQCPRGNR